MMMMMATSGSEEQGEDKERGSDVTLLPIEAREGLMRAWLEILRERHPDVIWVPVSQKVLDRQGLIPTRRARTEGIVIGAAENDLVVAA
jgi:hypothetical protein